MMFKRNATDPEGRPLIPSRATEPLRNEPIWAVYQFQRDSSEAVARRTDFIDLATAKTAVDALNGSRECTENYFRVLRRVDAAGIISSL
jgi:hypothetical protein